MIVRSFSRFAWLQVRRYSAEKQSLLESRVNCSKPRKCVNRALRLVSDVSFYVFPSPHPGQKNSCIFCICGFVAVESSIRDDLKRPRSAAGEEVIPIVHSHLTVARHRASRRRLKLLLLFAAAAAVAARASAG